MSKKSQHNPRSIARLFQSEPPHDIEAECALLGSMMLDPKVIGDVQDVLKNAEDLYLGKHATLYQTILDLYDKSPDMDAVMLKAELESHGTFEQIGGVEYLAELWESVPNAASAVRYATIVADRARKRELALIGAQVMEWAHGPDTAASVVDKSEAAIYAVAESKDGRGPVGAGDAMQDMFDRLQAGESQRGVETGLYELDDMLNGFQPGHLIIIAARPSMGKTAMAMQFSVNASVRCKVPTAFFSLEMSVEEVSSRIAAFESGIPLHRLRSGGMGEHEFGEIAMAVGRVSDSALYILDTPGLSLMQLRSRSRRLCHRNGVKFIVVDYLQLMTAEAESRVQEVSLLSRGLKTLARELGVPIVCLSQLNRKSEMRTNNRPMMSDLRESGSIEQDADVVILLHREDYYHKGDPNHIENHQADIIVEKQRQGPTGVVSALWDGSTVRFKPLARFAGSV